MEKFLWEPSGIRKKESLLENFSKYINIKSNYNFKNLWKWSVDHPEETAISLRPIINDSPSTKLKLTFKMLGTLLFTSPLI